MKDKSNIVRNLIVEYGNLIITSSYFVDYLTDTDFFTNMSASFKIVVKSLHKSGFGTIMYRIAQSDSEKLLHNPEWKNHISEFLNKFNSQSEYKESIIYQAAEILVKGVLPKDYEYNAAYTTVLPIITPQNEFISQDNIPVINKQTHKICLEKKPRNPSVESQSESSSNSSTSTTSIDSLSASPTPVPPPPPLTPHDNSSSHNNSKSSFQKYLVVGATLGVIVLIIFTYYHRQNSPFIQQLKKEKMEFTFSTPKYNIFELLDDCFLNGADLSHDGNKRLDSLLNVAPNDYWLLFIKNKKKWIIPKEIQNSLISVNNTPKAKSNKRNAHYIEAEIFHITLMANDYLSFDDIVYHNQKPIVDAQKAQQAIKQFQKDAGLIPDGKLTKQMIDLLNLWKPIWSSKPIGFRQIKDMEWPGFDSDDLIRSLRKAEFFTDSCKLVIKNYDSHIKPSKMSDIFIAVARAEAKDPIDTRGIHYDVPDDLDICVRAFQAYHNIRPDGILNEETIKLLDLYSHKN
ncbi:MAG: peptidoglycan-binding protein [Muribaculaceae bacterium]|nr:peptidoglycan-binding protein [Muribaculaceae bacterium]